MLLQKENLIPETFEKSGSSIISVAHSGTVQDLKVTVDIRHANSGDLSLRLVAPSGKAITLQKEQGKGRNIQKSFKGEDIKKLLEEKTQGDWELKVKNQSDHAGKIFSWNMELGCSKQKKSEIFIPDEDPNGLTSIQVVKYAGIIKDIKLKVDIKHPYKGDLHVQLVSPSRKTVVVHDREGGSTSNLKKSYRAKDVLKDLVGQKTAGKWKLQVKDFADKDSGTLRAWKLEITYYEADDLKKIEGIGPKIEGILNAAGIRTFKRLSITSPLYIKQLLTAAGDRYKMHDPASWPLQAEMAHAGNWKKLEKWQDKHKGGRLN